MISVESIGYSDDENGGRPDNENIQSLDSLMADLGNMVKVPRSDNVDRAPSEVNPIGKINKRHMY